MPQPKPDNSQFIKSVDKQAQRKLSAQKRKRHNIWFGLGMFGLIGWSIALATVAGIALVVWIDQQWPGKISWTLTLLFVGLVIGCMNAWRWIDKESHDD